MTRQIGIFIYPEVEVLDFTGPFEVFATAARLHARAEPTQPPLFVVSTIAEQTRVVHARGDLLVSPHHHIHNHPRLDVLIVPGGVVTAELNNTAVLRWIAQVAHTAEIIASVCTGAFLLAKAGLLEAQTATTHWEDCADLRTMFPTLTVKENVRWVDNGHVITSAGIAAGIDMSLHIVARLTDETLAVKTARQMEVSAEFLNEQG
jgi:transcriptional regulator GlxA family with amidase domain